MRERQTLWATVLRIYTLFPEPSDLLLMVIQYYMCYMLRSVCIYLCMCMLQRHLMSVTTAKQSTSLVVSPRVSSLCFASLLVCVRFKNSSCLCVCLTVKCLIVCLPWHINILLHTHSSHCWCVTAKCYLKQQQPLMSFTAAWNVDSTKRVQTLNVSHQ